MSDAWRVSGSGGRSTGKNKTWKTDKKQDCAPRQITNQGKKLRKKILQPKYELSAHAGEKGRKVYDTRSAARRARLQLL